MSNKTVEALRKQLNERLDEMIEAKRNQPYDEFIRELLRDIQNPLIVDAFSQVDIRPFLPKDQRDSLVNTNSIFLIQPGDTIAERVTLSERYLTAQMIELLRPNKITQKKGKILEIGTGSGYLAAVLSKLYATVHTVEVKPGIAQRASHILRDEGYRSSDTSKTGVTVHIADGAVGLPSHGPYNAIIVTAAFKSVPQALIDQLKPGGRLVVPVGAESFFNAHLILVNKKTDGAVEQIEHHEVNFLPVLSTTEETWSTEEAIELSNRKTAAPVFVEVPHHMLGLANEPSDSDEDDEIDKFLKRAQRAREVSNMAPESIAACAMYICEELDVSIEQISRYLAERGTPVDPNASDLGVYRMIVFVNTLSGWSMSLLQRLAKE